MSQSPNFRSRIPSTTGLPRVSRGMNISPNHINGMAEGIDKVTLRKGVGYTFKQTSGGTMLNITQENKTHPWKCVCDGVNIYINVGKIWGNGVMEHPNSTLMTRSGYDASYVYFGGRTLFVDVDKATCISSDSVNDSETGELVLAVPAKKGYYYIEYSKWESNDTMIDDDASDKALNTRQFILKYKPLTGILPKGVGVYPVCELQDDNLLVQGITSDIYNTPYTEYRHAFQIYITDFEGDAYIEVAGGTVCNIEANYSDGTNLGDPDGGIAIGTTAEMTAGTRYLYIEAKANISNGSAVKFPDPAQGIILRSGGSIPTSGGSTAYVGIGKVVIKDNVATISQYVTGSLWGEYFKLGSKPAEYWFSRI